MVQVSRDFGGNGRRRYNGETSEGVPVELVIRMLVLTVRSRLAVNIIIALIWTLDGLTLI